MDYDLDRLGPIAFERLVQALLLAEFGSDIQVFGPGRDGGREAAFASLNYRDERSGRLWNGYGIVQAKYVDATPQQDHGTASFLNAVRDELRQWTSSQSRKKRPPKFILFATTARLSAVPDSGGIDTFHSRAGYWARQLALLGSDVWAYHKICALLDKHEGVRRAYLASILPGDFMAAMIDRLDLSGSMTAAAMYSNLASDIQDLENTEVGELGKLEEWSPSLSSVFIDVPAAAPEMPTEGVVGSLIEQFDQPMRMVGTTGSTARVVLVGGPGQGKTTLSKWIAQLYRLEILQSTERPLNDLTTRAMTSVNSARLRVAIPRPVNRRWPIRIELDDYALKLRPKGKAHAPLELPLTDYLIEAFNSNNDLKIDSAHFMKWVSEWPTIVILDGMDEVPPDLRGNVVRQIGRLGTTATMLGADICFLITTRPQGDRTDFSPDEFQHWELQRLSTKSATAYSLRLADVLYKPSRRKRAEMQDEIESAIKDEAKARLMTTPLQVAIMTLLIERNLTLPERRFDLFDTYFEAIYAREAAKRTPLATALKRYRPQIVGVIERAGLLLQLRGEGGGREGRAGARVTSKELEDLIRSVMRKAGLEDATEDPDEPDDEEQRLSRRLMASLKDRLVIFVSHDQNLWEFEVTSLREYAAARACTSGLIGANSAREILSTTGPSNYWRNVWLLTAGRIFAEKFELQDTLINVVTSSNKVDELAAITHPTASLAVDVLLDRAWESFPIHARQMISVAFGAEYAAGPKTWSKLGRAISLFPSDALAKSLIQNELNQVESRVDEADAVALAVLKSIARSSSGWVREESLARLRARQENSIHAPVVPMASFSELWEAVDKGARKAHPNAVAAIRSASLAEKQSEVRGLEVFAAALVEPALRREFASLILGLRRNGLRLQAYQLTAKIHQSEEIGQRTVGEGSGLRDYLDPLWA